MKRKRLELLMIILDSRWFFVVDNVISCKKANSNSLPTGVMKWVQE